VEWRLEGLDDIRADRGWMDLENQPGFRERSQMIADLVTVVFELKPNAWTLTDIGCGDGALLAKLGLGPRAWGYELGAGDVAHARSRGFDVMQKDILHDTLDYGDVLVVSEVLEHLDNPVNFLTQLPRGRVLIASSPSRETGDWHNPIHTWAWDLEGYADVVKRGGWRVIFQMDCDGGTNVFNGVLGEQRFQAIVAVR
jgi:SAM-dependent methyltransferase